jgi:O-antigen/teichoic acid export membrane protein
MNIMPTTKKFVGQGIMLFLDTLIVSVTNWIFWLLASKLTSSSEIGTATTIYSLSTLIGMSTQLGLEYSLLKKSLVDQSQILGTTLVIKSAILFATTPMLIYIINNMYNKLFSDFAWMAIGIFISYSVIQVTHYALLGTLNVMGVLVIDVVGATARFGSGYILLSMGYGASGLLIALLVQGIIITAASLALLIKRIGMRLTGGSIKYAKEIVSDGLVNTPYTLSKVFIIYLSVVLLASFGVSSSDIGVFYISLMISIVVGGSLASSIALMVIPASSQAKRDLSSEGIRIGLSLTAPLIAALITGPQLVLSLLGPEYMAGDIVLLLLSIGILPYSVTINIISAFNLTGQHKKIILIGAIEILTFVLTFWLLVPAYGIVGTGFSMLVAFIVSSIPAMAWSGRTSIMYVVTSVVSIATGWTVGFGVSLVTGAEQSFIQVFCSSVTALIMIIILKNLTIDEIRHTVGALIRK